MSRTIISIIMEKGGVGKTTTTFNLGCALAKLKKKILLVDLDKQKNLTITCGRSEGGNRATISDLIFNYTSGNDVVIEDYIQHDEQNGVDFIASHLKLDAVNSFLEASENNTYVLREIFSDPVFDRYDYILFDSKPAVDILIQNSLNCADYAIIPSDLDIYSLRGVANTLKKIEENPNIQLLGILLNKVTPNTNIEKELLTQFVDKYGELIFKTRIPERKKQIKEAGIQRRGCVNVESNTLSQYYIKLAKEVIERSK